MENCSLAIRIPYSDSELEGGAGFSLGEGSKFDIYALDEPKPVNVQKLSWVSRPPRRERVAIAEPKAGEETTLSWFACPWNSLHTFEIACADEGAVDCLVDVWTSQNKTWGECHMLGLRCKLMSCCRRLYVSTSDSLRIKTCKRNYLYLHIVLITEIPRLTPLRCVAVNETVLSPT